MDRLLAELQRPVHAKLLESISEAYKTSGDDLELFGSTSLHTLESLPGYKELLKQQLCAAGVSGCVSDVEVSADAKEAAKAHFMCKRYQDACQSYTRALQMLREGPGGSIDERSSDLYADRALCLLRLVPAAAEAAYADCTAAVACNSSNHKAWYRRALASEARGRHGSALEDAREANKLMASHGWSSPQLNTLLQRLAESLLLATPSKPFKLHSASECPTEAVNGLQQDVAACELGAERSYRPSLDEALGAAAPGLSVRTSQGTGRYLIASQELDAGSIVIEEDPFVVVLAKSQRSQRCSVCFEAMPMNPVFCRSCPIAAYCSLNCRAADACHIEGGRECGQPWPLLLSDDARLALRLAAKLAKEGGSSSGNSSIQHVNSLEHHWGRAPFLAALPTVLLACLAYSCWTNGSGGLLEIQHLSQNSEEQIGLVTAGSVMRALGQVQVNGVAIVPRSYANVSGRRGLAVYPVVSMMNHACVPATQLDWQGRRLVARTLRKLQPGDEVRLSYGPQQGSMVTSVRRDMLLRQYHFVCLCEACERPLDSELAMVGLACRREGCTGAIVPSRACHAGLLSIEDLPTGSSPTGLSSCPICQDQYLGEGKTFSELESCAEQFDAAMQALAKSGRTVSTSKQAPIDSAVIALCPAQINSCLEVRRRLLHAHNELIGFTENALADAIAATSKQWLKAATACSRSIHILRAAYPANSLTVAYQQIKYSTLLHEAGKDEAAENELGEARLVLALHFGSPHAEDLN